MCVCVCVQAAEELVHHWWSDGIVEYGWVAAAAVWMGGSSSSMDGSTRDGGSRMQL